MGQVDLGHQYVFHRAVRQADGFRLHPDDVAGQVADLVGAQRDARAQVVLLREADAVGHQLLVAAVVALAAGGCAAGQFDQLVAHQALFIEAVAEAFLRDGRIGFECIEQVVAADPVAVVGELRTGFEHVAAAGVRVQQRQAVRRHLDHHATVGGLLRQAGAVAGVDIAKRLATGAAALGRAAGRSRAGLADGVDVVDVAGAVVGAATTGIQTRMYLVAEAAAARQRGIRRLVGQAAAACLCTQRRVVADTATAGLRFKLSLVGDAASAGLRAMRHLIGDAASAGLRTMRRLIGGAAGAGLRAMCRLIGGAASAGLRALRRLIGGAASAGLRALRRLIGDAASAGLRAMRCLIGDAASAGLRAMRRLIDDAAAAGHTGAACAVANAAAADMAAGAAATGAVAGRMAGAAGAVVAGCEHGDTVADIADRASRDVDVAEAAAGDRYAFSAGDHAGGRANYFALRWHGVGNDLAVVGFPGTVESVVAVQRRALVDDGCAAVDGEAACGHDLAVLVGQRLADGQVHITAGQDLRHGAGTRSDLVFFRRVVRQPGLFQLARLGGHRTRRNTDDSRGRIVVLRLGLEAHAVGRAVAVLAGIRDRPTVPVVDGTQIEVGRRAGWPALVRVGLIVLADHIVQHARTVAHRNAKTLTLRAIGP